MIFIHPSADQKLSLHRRRAKSNLAGSTMKARVARAACSILAAASLSLACGEARMSPPPSRLDASAPSLESDEPVDPRAREPGADALDPLREPSFLPTYDAKLRQAFARAWADDVDLRTVRLPSFVKESVVGLRHEGTEGHWVFLLEPSIQIWTIESSELELRGEVRVVGDDAERENAERRKKAAEGPRLSDVRVVEHAAPLDAEAAKLVLAAHRAMLDRVKTAPSSSGLDGVTYQFHGRRADGGEDRGATWSPPRGTQPRRLMRLADALASYTTMPEAERPEGRRALVELAASIVSIAGKQGAERGPAPRQAE